MKVIVLNHMRQGILVHRPGCRDIKTQLRLCNSQWEEEIPGINVAQEIATLLCEDFSDPTAWQASDVRVLPCVGKVGK